nr:hypothetical protein [Tanacetum cinerariifolium]
MLCQNQSLQTLFPHHKNLEVMKNDKSPTGRLFDQEGKLVASSEYESQSDYSNGDNACTSNAMEPKIKRFPNSTSLLDRNDHVAAFLDFGDLQWGNIFSPGFISLKDWVTTCSRINGKRYVLVIVDDYSRYTWVNFLRSKDEAPYVIITFLKRITVLLQSPVIIIRTDNGTDFKNQVLKEYFDTVDISHQMSFVRTPQQNEVVERRNRTLVEAARTMLFFLVHRYSYVLSALCYPKNDHEDIGKLGAKGDIGFFIGYSADSCANRIYNRRTKKIMETMNVSFDELSAMAFEQRELDLLFKAMYDDYIGGQPSATARTDVDELNSNAMIDGNTFVNPFANSSTSAAESSSSQNVDPSNMHTFYQPYPHEFQWTKDYPLEQNVKEAMTDPAWIDSMQEELLQFKRLDVWVLVPAPDNISPLTLKWLFKNKYDEEQMVI